LDHEGIDWICYESDFTFLRVFEPYRLDFERVRPFEEFLAREQPLPPVTLLDPDFTGSPGAGPPNDDHPPTSIAAGQVFIQQVVDKLQSLPSWPRTMLVVTYDEHGGFADHVPPPGTGRSGFPPASDGTPTVPLGHPDVASLGVRVPALVVCPVATAGGVGHQVYDHATVFRTVVERFMPDLRNSAVLPERVRRARHLGEVVVPGTRSTEEVRRLESAMMAAAAPEPAAVIHRDSDDHRPHRAAPPSLDDFAYFIERFGNPIPPP
jgi:phospholipase C